MSNENHTALIAELHSAARTLSMNGTTSNTTNKVVAELIERAADALATAYTPAQMAESVRAGLATAAMQEGEEHGRK